MKTSERQKSKDFSFSVVFPETRINHQRKHKTNLRRGTVYKVLSQDSQNGQGHGKPRNRNCHRGDKTEETVLWVPVMGILEEKRM